MKVVTMVLCFMSATTVQAMAGVDVFSFCFWLIGTPFYLMGGIVGWFGK